MRTSFAVVAGLVAVASAGTTTITDTVDVTITSCAPSVTNCPYKGGAGSTGTWSDWDVSASTTSSKPVSPVSSGTWDPTWSDWVSSTTTKPVKDATTSTAWDPTWSDWVSSTSSVPVKPASTSSVYDGTWSDWASASTLSTVTATPVSAAVTSYATGAWSSAVTPVAAASTTSAAWAAYSGAATGVSPATFTGAANANTGSFALAGLVAAAAMVMA